MASVNVAALDQKFKQGDIINIKKLKKLNLVGSGFDRYKVLGDGEIKKKLTVFADGMSRTAKTKIEKSGGAIKLTARAASQDNKTKRPKTDQKTKPKSIKKNIKKKDVPKVS